MVLSDLLNFFLLILTKLVTNNLFIFVYSLLIVYFIILIIRSLLRL